MEGARERGVEEGKKENEEEKRRKRGRWRRGRLQVVVKE